MNNYTVIVHLTVNAQAGHADDAEEYVQRELQKVLKKANFEVMKVDIHNTIKILQQSTFETNLFGNESKADLVHRTSFEIDVLKICTSNPKTMEEIIQEMNKIRPMFDMQTIVAEILAKLMRYNLIVRRNSK